MYAPSCPQVKRAVFDRKAVLANLKLNLAWVEKQPDGRRTPVAINRASNLLIGCHQLLAVCGVGAAGWVDRRKGRRRALRNIRERYTEPDGKRALRQLVALTIAALEAATWIKTMPVGALPTPRTVEEVGQILKACAETPGVVGNLRASEFWPALVLVLFDSGMRLGSALQVRRTHLDVKKAWLFVPGEHQKHKADQRFRLSAGDYPLPRRRVFRLQPEPRHAARCRKANHGQPTIIGNSFRKAEAGEATGD